MHFSKQVGFLEGYVSSSIHVHPPTCVEEEEAALNEISRPNGESQRPPEVGPTVAPIILLEDQSFLGISVRFMLCISHLHLLH